MNGRENMTRRILIVCLAVCCWSLAVAASAQATALCVGGPGCFPSIQAAVDAAHDGDVIRVGPGTFAGGVVIDKDIRLLGVGAGDTIIEGGGPVIQIGQFFGMSRPTVTIRHVTITGGANNSHPDAQVVAGGGVWIPPHDGNTTGATVTITDSVITGNSVSAQFLIPPGFCGDLPCAFASGAGIDSSGNLTLADTRVSDNTASSPPGVATGVSGGGIVNHPQGTLVLAHVWVTGNDVRAGPPNGRTATSGGIANDGTLSIRDSVVAHNVVELASVFPGDVDQVAFGGGVMTGDFPGASATISHTIVRGNRVSAMSLVNNPNGVAGAFAGGILAFGDLDLAGSVVDHNDVTSTVPPGAGGAAFTDGGGLEVDAHTTITDTAIVGNTINSTAGTGFALVQGGGLANVGQLVFKRSLLLGNVARASGATGIAQGGGLWNGTFDPSSPTPELALVDSTITLNRLSATPGITPQGGGVYSDFTVTRIRTVIAGNSPDQCFGC
jgi:hypothetical protein